jgi:hypothetical protein
MNHFKEVNEWNPSPEGFHFALSCLKMDKQAAKKLIRTVGRGFIPGKIPQNRFVSGHDFTACGKTHLKRQVASGHDFSRAVSVTKKMLGFSPCGLLFVWFE